MSALLAGLVAGAAYIGCVFCCKCVQECQERKHRSLQQEDIFNISSRVQNQENQWTSRDNGAYLSIEHINISNQINKPPYNDAPPSYEEAMRIAIAQSIETAQPTATSTTSPPPPPPQVVVEAPKPSS